VRALWVFRARPFSLATKRLAAVDLTCEIGPKLAIVGFGTRTPGS
jgi:hypothetical protein